MFHLAGGQQVGQAQREARLAPLEHSALLPQGQRQAQAQAQVQVKVQRAQQQPLERRVPTGQPYRASQPVAIQPKKPVATKGELCLCLTLPVGLWPMV